MHFPRYWQLARKGGVCAWGWSDLSLEEALVDGQHRVDRIIRWLKHDRKGERGSYGYPDRPMREEVLRELRHSDGNLTGVVSRNSYGCEVLNTAIGMFVDVDEPQPSLLARLRRLFGAGTFESRLLDKCQRWIATHQVSRGCNPRPQRTAPRVRWSSAATNVSSR